MGDLLTFGVQETLKQAVTLVAKKIIASSEFKVVLEELKDDLLHAEWILHAIKTKHDHSLNDKITHWVNDLQLFVYEAEDMLDLFAYDDVERKIRSNKVEETTSLLENYVVGREMEVESIVQDVIEASQQQLNSILPVYGTGGSGKTTLAQLVFNDERIGKQFHHTVWVCVSQPFVINEILQSILKKVSKSNDNRSKDDKDTLIRNLKEVMGGKRYFLVLDNVWNENKMLWEKLKECLMSIVEELGSSVLVTTRSRKIAEMMKETLDTYHLNKLTDDQCWSVFSYFAKANAVPITSNLELVREEVVKKIGGLPLLARVLGEAAQFSGDYEKWVEILKSIPTTPLKYEESSYVKYILKLSVDRLPKASIKQCFAYCSNFPKGYWFDKKQVIKMWMAHGFTRPDEGNNETMEDTGKRYFNILLSYCLFQDADDDKWHIGRKFRMHDLIHDIACDVSSDKRLQLDHSSSSKWKENVCELPNSISKLKHLRYLDISRCYSIKKLPESIVGLYNLQTLRLFCLTNDLLPTNLRRMVSLRHLEILLMGIDLPPKFEMPPYLSELVQLQTLFAFAVGFETGRKISELGGLRNLKGLLKLHRLEHVESKEEAKAAKLVEKEKVEGLNLSWRGKWKNSGESE
ncbi:hypothetical protein Csa_019319 [Cucumis sativus]|nr:hypothetical protein Csa_019319 [Cucumis sativus]